MFENIKPLTAAQRHADINEYLIQCEHDFLSFKFCNCIASLESRFAEEFIECGVSGMHTRQDVIQYLHKITADRKIELSDFYVDVLNDGIALVRYKAFFKDTGRISSHSSIWVKRDNDWKLYYHQGTLVNNGMPGGK